MPELSDPHKQSPANDRPGLVVVSPAHAPYRLALHRRLAREIPELRLWSLFTCRIGHDDWNRVTGEIGPVSVWQPPAGPLPTHLRDWATGGRITRWLRDHDVAAVVLLGYADAARLRAFAWCLRHRVPALLWADSNIRNEPAGGLRLRLKELLLPRVLRRFAAWLPCGQRGRDYFLKYGADPNGIFYFPNEPDYHLIWDMPPQRIEQIKDRFGLKEGRRRLIFSGRLIRLKRIDLIIDAFCAIAGQRAGWDLVIAGEGELRGQLESLVPTGLSDRVVFTGFLEQSDLSALYRACDALILASSYEAWALVLNEAAAAGLAIVASDIVGATPELVRDGINGRTFPSGDRTALVAALLEVTDESRIDNMKRASRQVLEDWRRVGDPVAGLRKALASCGVIRGAAVDQE